MIYMPNQPSIFFKHIFNLVFGAKRCFVAFTGQLFTSNKIQSHRTVPNSIKLSLENISQRWESERKMLHLCLDVLLHISDHKILETLVSFFLFDSHYSLMPRTAWSSFNWKYDVGTRYGLTVSWWELTRPMTIFS